MAVPLESTSRRTFLGQLGRLALGVAFAPLAGCEDNAFAPVIEGQDISFVTPNEEFYIQFGANAGVADWKGIPALDRASWQLRLDGLLGTPMTLSLSDLGAEVPVTFLSTLRCIVDGSNVPGLVGTAAWTGVPLRTFLDRAGLNPERVRRLRIYGADGFTDNLTLDKLYGDRPSDLVEPMLVYDMNGQPLEAGHGAPVRLLVPGHYGHKSIKWVERIEATDDDTVFGTYQNVLGYADDGMIRVVNKTTNVLRGAQLAPGTVRVAGFALSGYAGIRSVEVALDDGPYEQARLLPLDPASDPLLQGVVQLQDPDRFAYPYRGVWTLWEYWWQATPGAHTLTIRATDDAGHAQPDVDPDASDGDNPVFAVNVLVK